MKTAPAKPKSRPTTQPTPQSAVRTPHSDAQPSSVLLAVTGMSPAVLTETVWALAHEPEPVIPSRVIVVTTAQGRVEIERQLFQPVARFDGQTAWNTLRATLARDGADLGDRLRFGTTADDIRVITTVEHPSQRSRELQDLRTPKDNDACADFLLEQVRAIVENPDTRLIASIAGGRKTMGALLYACMTLAGRETDRLTHVLVSEPFETLREFYFPAQPGGPLLKSQIPNPKSETSSVDLKSGITLDPSAARLDLADVPFVPLRNLFVRELGRKAGTFSRLVASCLDHVRQRAAEGLRFSLDSTRPEVEVNGVIVKLAPPEHLLLLFLARRAKHGEPPFASYKESVDAVNAFRSELLSVPKDFSDWRYADSLRATWEERDVTKALSGIRIKLRTQGGDAALLAACLPEKGRCSLDVPGSLIFIK